MWNKKIYNTPNIIGMGNKDLNYVLRFDLDHDLHYGLYCKLDIDIHDEMNSFTGDELSDMVYSIDEEIMDMIKKVCNE